jgi:hypothetical protein
LNYISCYTTFISDKNISLNSLIEKHMVWFIENKVCNHLPNSSFQQTVV